LGEGVADKDKVGVRVIVGLVVGVGEMLIVTFIVGVEIRVDVGFLMGVKVTNTSSIGSVSGVEVRVGNEVLVGVA
jgi:hypothetical protein